MGASLSRPPPPPKCVSCYSDDSFQSSRLRCNHHYCRSCLQRMFEMAATTEPFAPPRCCGCPIKIEYARQTLSAEELQPYMTRVDELDAALRPWRSCPNCGTNIILPARTIPSRARTTLKCPKCKVGKVCTGCGAAAHQGRERCDDQRLFELALNERWKRCPHCGTMVEKREGCNNMVCVCGGFFCYRCGKWKCRCRWKCLRW
ncbi:hypothetical protein BC936DRAFT_140599 [Jimgerdemannia flammicorona]|uniref:RING-type domain-containing protein n=1 Tax=Jimgerdemannia flammicorona TaxID=994334 RepID=A0A433AKB3_9FUNG|nr:hypothetical protein BC936DRAFT_140599 [Jimgerdemannia flammicorona]